MGHNYHSQFRPRARTRKNLKPYFYELEDEGIEGERCYDPAINDTEELPMD